jgi:hypothetical protein
MNTTELLEREIKHLQEEKGQLIIEKSTLVIRIHVLEKALARMVRWQNLSSGRDLALGPELPNGEGISGEPSAGIGGVGAGYHVNSVADPRD